MAPNLFGSSATLYLEASQQDVHQEKSTIEKENNQKLIQKSSSSKSKYKWKIVWRNVIAFIYFHFGGLYGFYLWGNGSTKAYTILWSKYKYLFIFNYI